ncbi:tryptophan synthase subunit beta [Solidesulfovibrio sp.]|uniref:tryptophan synthase subunit beta n=1 Tax=Solidesulfovibrio sp. TaxID=2910990 RepID=UPI002B1EDA34|nr:tryptophan synthase subunit beta [Solidesulfovibrio sp.]MEA5090074.1 tryptophan synthase subunit beta [Solidesulfovibrio sp.]
MRKRYYGDFGGQFVPELLMPPLLELEEAMRTIVPSEAFQNELNALLADYVGRPSPLYRCPNLSKELGFDLWLKREDLNHTGAHKINNTMGQGLLTKYMGKGVLLAETGAGQHGVATATAAAMLGLGCIVYMGAEDVVRQAHNVKRMKLLGAEVVPIESGTKTLKDAINAALRYWIAEQRTTHYCFGTAAGPHPFPLLVREFQAVISREARAQCLDKMGRLPDYVVACVGGGSNAIGMFHHFVPDASVKLIGVEAGGTGEPGCYNSAPISLGTPGVLHGMRSMLLQTTEGQIQPSHSVSAGLDYPGVGPEHAHLGATGRVRYDIAVDREALAAFEALCRREGIIPALESCHAVAWVRSHAAEIPKGAQVVVCLSGRGDKDLGIIEAYEKEQGGLA